ncbi:MAG: nucleotide exchange factor GrpE, partial [Campylobacter sp.]|nr:nucleotide exchange factor GrpE [Campylobacter sp.]
MKEENKDDLVNFDALKDEQKEQNQPESQEVAQDDAEALAIATEELANVKTKLIEAHADFENIKKRLEKEKITAVNFA